MSRRHRSELVARLLLTAGALLPYWRFLALNVIYVTDDVTFSDIYNGELPGRLIFGHLVRAGQWPVWTSKLCSGLPLDGFSADPIGLASFTWLPPAPALDVLVISFLLIAAHGAYGLARRFGAGRAGAVLAGLAFAGSGYIAGQLEHLSILSTVVWLPWGLLLLDRSFGSPLPGLLPANPAGSIAPGNGYRRTCAVLFGLVFGNQVLAGFPQSAYICALVYCAFVVFRSAATWRDTRSWRGLVPVLSSVALATLLGAAVGAVVLLPLGQLGALSDRAQPLGWAWSTQRPYWPANFVTFLIPYFNGDISNRTYVGRSIFWEDYGYVGAATAVLALMCTLAGRRRRLVLFLAGMTFVAYLFVLGPFTPAFRLAYELIPGLKIFRFPTRFLVVVDLGIAVLGGLGLTFVRADLSRMTRPASRLPAAVAVGVCILTAADLWFHQPRQNPVVPAAAWLAAPATADMARDSNAEARTFSPGRYEIHERAFVRAAGWSHVEPYFELRDLLEPNVGGGYWNLPSADCYSGIAPRWSVDVWGDHLREGLLVRTLVHQNVDRHVIEFDPPFANVLKTYGVTTVVTGFPAVGTPLSLVGHTSHAYVYRVKGAERVRVVSAAVRVASDEEAAAKLRDVSFDPDRAVLLHDAPASLESRATGNGEPGGATGQATITGEDSTHVEIDADASADGFLLLADTYYPGWSAEVDGRTTPIYRANLSVRAIALPRGRHHVQFTYRPYQFNAGLRISAAAAAVLALWAGAAGYMDRRERRYRTKPTLPQMPMTT